MTGVGVDRLAPLLAEIGPSPQSRPPFLATEGDSVIQVACDPDGKPLAHVFKTISDPYVGKISLMRVDSGTLCPDSILNNRAPTARRAPRPGAPAGEERSSGHRGDPGDIVAVPKLADVITGDTLEPKGSQLVLAPVSRASLSGGGRHPPVEGDEDKLMTGLHRLQEEDPDIAGRAGRRDASDHPVGHG